MTHPSHPNMPGESNAHDHHEGPHISSVRTLVTVFVALLAFTAITVFTAKMTDLGDFGDIVLALGLASVKGTLVCLYFMHLRYDNVFYSFLFLSCLGALALFLGLTMLDINNRDNIDPIRSQHAVPVPLDIAGRARFDEAQRLGRDLYMANCAACHAVDARGIPGLGENLIGDSFVLRSSDAELVDFIIKGRTANDPLSETGVPMPPRGGNPNLTDEQIAQIVVYVRALQPKDAKPKP